jgi:hypothetical protein
VAELEPATWPLEALEERHGPRDRPTLHTCDAKQLERSGRVVRVGLSTHSPREATAARLVREDEPRRRR